MPRERQRWTDDGFIVGGIDPGLSDCGWARLFVPYDHAHKPRVVDHGVYCTPTSWPLLDRVQAIVEGFYTWLEAAEALGMERFIGWGGKTNPAITEGITLVVGGILALDWRRRPSYYGAADTRRWLCVPGNAPKPAVWTIAASLTDGFPWDAEEHERDAAALALVAAHEHRAAIVQARERSPMVSA